MNIAPEEARRYEFFEFLARLEAQAKAYPPIGCSKSPKEDSVRLGQAVSLAHAPTEIDRWEPAPEARSANEATDQEGRIPPRLYVSFFGLTGPRGPLPLHMTELALRRASGRTLKLPGETASARPDSAMADFFDVFHHRMLSLLYRAWKAPRVACEDGDDSRYQLFLSSFIGENVFESSTAACSPPDVIPLNPKLYLAGLLGCPSRGAEGLERILSSFFATRVSVTEFVGQWVSMPPSEQMQLGNPAAPGRLGRDCIIGTRTWVTHLRIRVTLGPLSLEAYNQLAPGGSSHAQLKSWLTAYCGAELGVDVQLILRREDVTPPRLTTPGSRLGRTVWLSDHMPRHDPADLVFSVS